MNNETLKLLALFIILLIAVYTDLKGRIITDKLNIMALVLGGAFWIIEGMDLYYFISLFLSFIILVIIAFIIEGGIGGGDIKLLTVISFYIGILNWLTMFAIALIIALIIIGIIYLIKKEVMKNIVFAPYILIGYLSILLLNYIGIGGLL